MAIKTIGVIGAGQMGNGICQVAAYPGGINVIMNDIAEQFVQMIAAQRMFEANSKTITTADQLLSELIAMKR